MGSNESFYGTKIDDFQNVIYALDLKIIEHYASLVLEDDTSRIIIASNQYAFKERARLNNSNLNLPFMNFWLTDVSPSTDRTLWNNIANIEGLFSNELGTKLRIIPAKLSYEASLWMNRFEDLVYAQTRIMDDDSNETILYPALEISGYNVPNPAFLGYNLNFRPNYNEQDWLEQNKIQSLGLDFEFDIVLIVSDSESVYVTREIIFNFLSYSRREDLCTLLQNTPLDEISPKELIINNYTASDFNEDTTIIPLSLFLNRTSYNFYSLSDTFQLSGVVSPSIAENKTILWESDNEAIATVDNTGLVTSVEDGSATITATCEANTEIFKTCNIVIDSSVAVTGVSFDQPLIEIDSGVSGTAPQTSSASITILPSNATNKNVTYSFLGGNDLGGKVSFTQTGELTVNINYNGDPITRSEETTLVVETDDGSFTANLGVRLKYTIS